MNGSFARLDLSMLSVTAGLPDRPLALICKRFQRKSVLELGAVQVRGFQTERINTDRLQHIADLRLDQWALNEF